MDQQGDENQPPQQAQHIPQQVQPIHYPDNDPGVVEMPVSSGSGQPPAPPAPPVAAVPIDGPIFCEIQGALHFLE
eukprot:7496273-Pyramimonas_sp.AAC.1